MIGLLYVSHCVNIFTAIVVPGSVPDSHNADTSDSAYFKGIDLNSLYRKIFDNIILVCYSDKLVTSELRVGFKAKHYRPANLCSMVLKETISYYTNSTKSPCSVRSLTLPKHSIGFIIVSYLNYC
jgi:hypothetical protein